MKKKTRRVLALTIGGGALIAAISTTAVISVACGNPNYNQPKTVSITTALNDFEKNATDLVGSQTILPSQISSGALPQNNNGEKITNLWSSLNFKPILFANEYDYNFNIIKSDDTTGTLTFQVTISTKSGTSRTAKVVSQDITVKGFLNDEEYSNLQKYLNVTTGSDGQLAYSSVSGVKLPSTVVFPSAVYISNGKIANLGSGTLTPITQIDGSTFTSPSVNAVVMSRQITSITAGKSQVFPNVSVVKIDHNIVKNGNDAVNGMSIAPVPQNILQVMPKTTTYLLDGGEAGGVYGIVNVVDSLGNVFTTSSNSPFTGMSSPVGSINNFQNLGSKIVTQTVFYRYINQAVTPLPNSGLKTSNVQFNIFGGIPAQLNTGDYITLPTSFINEAWIKDPTSQVSLWNQQNPEQQTIWYASVESLYNANFPTAYRFSSYGSNKKPLVISNAPNPLPPTSDAANVENNSGVKDPVQYWSGGSYSYQVYWQNKTPDPYYYSPNHNGADFFGKFAAIYTTGGGTWQYCAEAYYSFGYVNMNADWGYDSNGQMFLTNTNLSIAQGLFATNNGKNFLAAVGGGSGSSPNSTGSINGNAIGMAIPWEFLALPDTYSALSAASISTQVQIWPNIAVYGQANLSAEVGRLNYIFVPDTYNNGLSSLLNTTPGVGNLMSGGTIIADTNDANYINGLATWLQGVSNGNQTYGVSFNWSNYQTILSTSGQITTQRTTSEGN